MVEKEKKYFIKLKQILIMNNKEKNQCHLIEMAHLGFSADSIAFVGKLCAWITENPADMKQLESFILGLCEETRDNNSDPELYLARVDEQSSWLYDVEHGCYDDKGLYEKRITFHVCAESFGDEESIIDLELEYISNYRLADNLETVENSIYCLSYESNNGLIQTFKLPV